MHAAQLGKNIQTGTQGAAESIHRFVETQAVAGTSTSASSSSRPVPDKPDFWESFGREDRPGFGAGGGGGGGGRESKPNAIGTAAMRKGGAGSGKAKAKEDGWKEEEW